jgi:hypothetical protein
MRTLLIALVLSSACATSAPTPAAPPPAPATITINEALQSELIAMREADQDVRRRELKDRDNLQIKAEREAIDKRNTARLREIIKIHGWPGKSLVGVTAGGGAWMIAQHGGPDILKETLPLMRQAVAKGELEGGLYATSFDRVRIQAGEKQVYGSQFDTEGDKCQPLPIEDEANVDARREEVGLGPLSEYTAQLCALYKQKKK